ncbi:MAG: hypothetical protein LBD60_03620 [Puniceicoccales bacterium]|jgi:hypothetical protein|nr:hypothetical protein [Puniceicoccales bacterium]
MKSSAKKILSVILGINGSFSGNLLSETAILSDEEEAKVLQEMNQALRSVAAPATDKAMNELLGANVRADSKEPEKFQSKARFETKKVKFPISRLLSSIKKWGQFEIIICGSANDKNLNYVDNCTIDFYAGYNGCLKNGKMLLFKSQCTCATLPIHKDQTICFFMPGDIRQRYNLTRPPDYCAVRVTVDGIKQQIEVLDKNGKVAQRSDSDKYHKSIKGNASTNDRIVRNADQLPLYADIKIPCHPTLLTEVDA